MSVAHVAHDTKYGKRKNVWRARAHTHTLRLIFDDDYQQTRSKIYLQIKSWHINRTKDGSIRTLNKDHYASVISYVYVLMNEIFNSNDIALSMVPPNCNLLHTNSNDINSK